MLLYVFHHFALWAGRMLGPSARVGWLELINTTDEPVAAFQEKLQAAIHLLHTEPDALRDVTDHVTGLIVTEEHRWILLWSVGACYIWKRSDAWSSPALTAGLLLYIAAFRKGAAGRKWLPRHHRASIRAGAEAKRAAFVARHA